MAPSAASGAPSGLSGLRGSAQVVLDAAHRPEGVVAPPAGKGVDGDLLQLASGPGDLGAQRGADLGQRDDHGSPVEGQGHVGHAATHSMIDLQPEYQQLTAPTLFPSPTGLINEYSQAA